MDVVSYLQDNLAEVTIIIGLIFLIVEIWVLGLSTIVLLALGLSTITTGVLVWVGILPATIVGVISGSGIGAGVLTAALWGPMKRIQKGESREFNVHSDLIGLVFELESPMDAHTPATVKYSGVSWQLVLGPAFKDAQLEAGDSVKVIAVDVGKFTVEPAN
ncbi:activity regulator of membrane protease YbbK [Enterovibrio norvegicus]|uniref:NfeD family protein n=1 Tax=Enterovibrio norvegicus TaxID=188144 RepID=UPI0003103905|nr:NfeD family protein [Enterovibrio norvegicus]OEF54481.1 activity regulator of membrane protease YbbK [Enterovibrio norvegicus]